MTRRFRNENDSTVVVEERCMKQLRCDRRGQDDKSWRSILEKLHYCLDNETEEDALVWLDNGTHFLVQQTREVRLAKRLGLRVCTLHQMLEAFNFKYQEDGDQREYTIYYHECFILGHPEKIEQILSHDMPRFSTDKDVEMPHVAYSSALKPLEVRLSLPDTSSQSYEVTIAPSVLPCPTFDAADVFFYRANRSVGNASFDESSEWSDHDVTSPLWWSQRSDFSSICTDDLSDMDTLSQISAYYA
ncbi:unnamed protein product [Peronospora belbahrii]|uniref:HSF-type DNA-binding domain-containing protein n=1 Tax=Peronospora belbahrii TaxID=622444 RepID=A0AAU9L3C8_9STRA|nr:unnamed protein product [Peronospora belbahrii]CAH0522220.1 unnamed protein product [Peronospora belbahrii]